MGWQHVERYGGDRLLLTLSDGDTRYEVTITRQKTLVTQRFLDFTKGWQKVVGKLIRYPGGYLRFSALVSMNCYQGDQRIEHYEKTGVFEQMYFARKIPELA